MLKFSAPLGLNDITMIYRIIIAVVMLMVFPACSANRAEMPHFATVTPNRVGTMMNEPTLPPLSVSSYTAPTAIPEDGVAVPEPPLPAKPCEAEYEHTRPEYLIEAVLDWDNSHIEVEEQVHYINTTGTYQDVLVFQVEPNRLPGVFALTGINT